jgi:beta-phosphoglucomutase
MNKENIKGVIFDMDGVITDNGEQDFLAWKRVFADFNLELTIEGYKSFTGMKGEEIICKYIRPEAGAEEATMLTRRKEDYFIEEIKKNKIEPTKGIERFLIELKNNNIKMGIGTAAKVAKYLNLKPEECVVIEDAPNGIEAAKNGGIKCIAITTTHKEAELKQADKIINSFDEFNIDELNKI